MFELGFVFFKNLFNNKATVVREPEAFAPFNLDVLNQWKVEDNAIKNGEIVPLNLSALKAWKANTALKAKTLAASANVDIEVANTASVKARKLANA
ncbi:MAG: hypothetical protein ACK5LE_02485 [Alphaproteobacteria bacterium]